MLSRFGQLVLALHRGCREQSVNAYQAWALDQVRTVFHFDSALWLTGTLDENCQAVVHTKFAYRLPQQVAADWAGVVSKGRAALTERVFRTPGITCNCVSASEFNPELLAYVRGHNIEHILATTSIDNVSRLNELISVYRADPANPYSEEERLVQQSIVPHLVETWRINRMQQICRAQQPACRAMTSMALTDNKGILHLIDPACTGLLLGEWPGWQGPLLPPELVRTIGKGESQFSGKTFISQFSHMGDFLMLRARNKTLLDNLSKREQEVAKLFASGMKHKELAQHLHLSASTVRNQLNTVYTKLGVNDKAALAAYLSQF